MSDTQSAAIPAGVGCPPGPPSETLEQHCRLLEGELTVLRENEARLRLQHSEWQRKERVLLRRLAAKEQEMQDLVNQISELKTNQTPGPAALRSALLDPAVNLVLQKLKNELQTTKARLEETQNELSAWKFTPDSNTGKRLMAKCRLLYQENEELGKMTSNGRFAKLEGDLALQKSFSDEVKKSQSELDDFLQELDEDVEGMQSTIYYLQQELRSAKETVQVLEQENHTLRLQKDSTRLVNGDSNKRHSDSEDRTKHTSPKWSCNRRDSSDSEPELIIKVSEQEICDDDSQDDQRPQSNACGKRTKHKISEQDRTKDITKNGIDTERTTHLIGKSLEFKKRNYESDSSDCSNERTNSDNKKARRSSVLSLDYNEDPELAGADTDADAETLVISTNGDINILDAD